MYRFLIFNLFFCEKMYLKNYILLKNIYIYIYIYILTAIEITSLSLINYTNRQKLFPAVCNILLTFEVSARKTIVRY
jgi:hypothetical protein